MSLGVHACVLLGVAFWVGTAEVESTTVTSTAIVVAPSLDPAPPEPPVTTVDVERPEDDLEPICEPQEPDPEPFVDETFLLDPCPISVIDPFAGTVKFDVRRRRVKPPPATPSGSSDDGGLGVPPARPAAESVPVAQPPPPLPLVAPVPSSANRQPKFPRSLRRRGIGGEVVLGVHVSEDGTVSEVEILTSSGHRRLDAAARAAAERWTYTPARRGAVACSIVLRQAVRFVP